MDCIGILSSGDYFMKADSLVHVDGHAINDDTNVDYTIFTYINGATPYNHIIRTDKWFDKDNNGNPIHVKMDDKYTLYQKGTLDSILNDKTFKKNNTEKEFITIIDALVNSVTKEEYVVYTNGFGRDISYQESFEYALNFMPIKKLNSEYTLVDPYKNLPTSN